MSYLDDHSKLRKKATKYNQWWYYNDCRS